MAVIIVLTFFTRTGKDKRMKVENGLTPQQALDKRKIKYAATGLLWAAFAAMTWALQGNLMSVAGGMSPFAGAAYSAMFVAVASIVTGAMHDFFAGCWLIIVNLLTGRSLKEYLRLGTTKIGSVMMLAAFFGGPMATGASLIGINMCGPTYALAIGATSPIVGAIAGRIMFKERMSARVWLGIVIAVAGVLVVSWAPPDGNDYPYFVIGIIASIFSSIGWGMEGVCCIYAADMTDSATACGLYRTFGSCLMTLVILIPIFGGIAGDVGFGFELISESFKAGTPVMWIVIAALAGGISYLSIYNAFPRAGAGRSLTVNVTYSLWSIPIGYLFLALGISNYSITGQAIIGCIVIFLGVVLVIGNPKDLVKLRDN